MVEIGLTSPIMKVNDKQSFRYGFNLTATVLIILFILSIPLFSAVAQYYKTVDITVVAPTASVSIPTVFTVQIENKQQTPLNAIEFELQYDPTMLVVTQVIPQRTLCEERFIITNSINHASGTIVFQCGTVTPYSGKTGTIATIHATALTAGTSSLMFASSTTHVLAHDGYGTDATANRTGISFTAI